MPETRHLPYGLTALIYTRGDRELAELEPETRARLDNLPAGSGPPRCGAPTTGKRRGACRLAVAETGQRCQLHRAKEPRS
ncbi:hypothetical protein [Gordonia hongkongensis]|uniref:hypothetical protein n=1 Tax=Gordonia hongkongensis TaxID=1701090 RepID=UPI003D75A5FB